MDEHLSQVARLIEGLAREPLEAIAHRLWQAYCEEARVFACGNGGSSATASHFVEDLAKGIGRCAGGRPFRAISLVDSVPMLTAYGNDMGYEQVFSEPLRNLAQAGDVLVAISASGRSANVLRASEAAREIGVSVVALTGRDGGELKGLADLCVVVPAESIQQIEDVHLAVTHALYLDLMARVEGTAR